MQGSRVYHLHRQPLPRRPRRQQQSEGLPFPGLGSRNPHLAMVWASVAVLRCHVMGRKGPGERGKKRERERETERETDKVTEGGEWLCIENVMGAVCVGRWMDGWMGTYTHNSMEMIGLRCGGWLGLHTHIHRWMSSSHGLITTLLMCV
mmetsp:Transcript_36818/g.92259  ORF Transcript_36818/g.92259 Transcript_36818/m.92259 type:complete len:149 (-) Transcript_36818:340-786(-)